MQVQPHTKKGALGTGEVSAYKPREDKGDTPYSIGNWYEAAVLLALYKRARAILF